MAQRDRHIKAHFGIIKTDQEFRIGSKSRPHTCRMKKPRSAIALAYRGRGRDSSGRNCLPDVLYQYRLSRHRFRMVCPLITPSEGTIECGGHTTRRFDMLQHFGNDSGSLVRRRKDVRLKPPLSWGSSPAERCDLGEVDNEVVANC